MKLVITAVVALAVLVFAPPITTGTSAAYAKTKKGPAAKDPPGKKKKCRPNAHYGSLAFDWCNYKR